MKTILCYGDSNTWGYNPATGAGPSVVYGCEVMQAMAQVAEPVST